MSASRRPVPAVGSAETTDLQPRLDELVEEWLTVPDAAEVQGVPLADIREQIRGGDLLAVRRGPNSAVMIPAVFMTGEGPRPEMKGTFTVLADAGFDVGEALVWLFTPDGSLPGGDSPMAAVLAGFKTEVRRRAMELAF